MADPFDPPLGLSWVKVSPRLRSMRRTTSSVFLGVMVLGVGVGALVGTVGGTLLLVLSMFAIFLLMLWAWLWWVIGRNFRSWGYVERADDLLVTHGALFRNLVVVPYGRMQLVDVEMGPIERFFGVVTVRLHTAGATTDARICGLRPEDATLLRDRLAALGESHAAGL